MKKRNCKNMKKSERGFLIIETIPMIFIFVTLVGFTLGFYGVTQRMILNSIAARAYGYEQIRHRANLTYFRDVKDGYMSFYDKTQLRYFSSKNPGSKRAFKAVKMNIKFPPQTSTNVVTAEDHNNKAYDELSRQGLRRRLNTRYSFDLVWIKTGYGICLTEKCEGR